MKQETRYAVSGAEGTVACRDEVAVVERRKSKETTKSEQPTSSSLRQFTSRPAQLVLTAQNWGIWKESVFLFRGLGWDDGRNWV